MTYVGGVAFSQTFLRAVYDKVEQEYNRALETASGDIAFFLSNHGTPTTLSFCFDSANDYIHNSYKAVFITAVKGITRRLKAKNETSGYRIDRRGDRRGQVRAGWSGSSFPWVLPAGAPGAGPGFGP